ncbi:MAG: LamG-like jellyroll fold domain-containing protein [Armatimonadota bacterium]
MSLLDSLRLLPLSILVLVVLCLPALAAQPLFRDAFAAGDVKAWTLQPPINAIGPIPANGTWKTEGSEFIATGTAAPWTVQTAGDAAWGDYKLALDVTIRKPGPKADFPIYSCEYDRYEAREDTPPFSGHAGEYRYRYFAGEFDWGSEAAVYFRYQDRENCYRVQFSTEYQEMILWHGIGGYLQVVPCALAAGKTYKLEVQAQGGHIQISLDGKKKIDFWHTCLPTLTGGIGLGAYHSTVAFRNVQVAALPALKTGAPEHKAVFADRKWRGLRWIFDSNEPILLLERNPYSLYLEKEAKEPAGPHTLMYGLVKLKPGYRPYYNTFVGVDTAASVYTGLLGTVDDIPITGGGTDRLTIQFDGITKDKKTSAHNTDVLIYDRLRGVYRHDMTLDVTSNVEQKLNNLEYCDPLTFNNHRPGKGVKYKWLPSNDDWGIFPGEDGNIYRHPISKGLTLGEGWYTLPAPSYWMLYPGRAACPVFEHIAPKERNWIIVCHWGHDYHNAVRWESGRQFKAGEKYTIRYALTAYTTEEGEQLFLRSKMNALHENLEEKQKNNLFLVVPSPYAFPIVDPSGTTFDTLQSAREPFTGWHWMGDYTMDREVGHTDRYSLRLDGPANLTGTFYHNVIDVYGKKYLCSVWIKTKGVRGKGPVVQLKYTFDESKGDIIETGLIGDNDWQLISFITDNAVKVYDSTDFRVKFEGAGTVWIDDFSVRPIEEGEKVEEHRPTATPVAMQPSPDYLIDLPATEGDGLSLFDASGHNNSAKLHGVTWTKSGNRPVLHFENGASAFVTNMSPELRGGKDGYAQAALTLEAWVRPAAGKGGGAIIGFLGSPVLSLQPEGKDKFKAVFAVTMLKTAYMNITSASAIPADQWSHVAGTMTADGILRIYVNGKSDGEKKLESNKIVFSAWAPMISIGTYGKRYGNNFTGDLAALRWWARAATDGEIAKAAEKAPDKQ